MKWLKEQQTWVKAVVLGSAAVVMVGAITVLGILVAAPAVRYSRAGARITRDPAGAFDAFYHMGDYRNARERAEQIRRDIFETRTEDSMEFGGHAWLVLEQRDGRALLLLDGVLPTRQYHASLTDITWEHSGIRQYLNSTFLAQFNAQDQARIIETEIFNPGNPMFGTPGGNNTRDHIFLLSLAEARLYFAQTTTRVGRQDHINAFWWLRSPGMEPMIAATVLSNGELGMAGSAVNATNRHVRPAMWITIEA
jgi:hypothetical protein